MLLILLGFPPSSSKWTRSCHGYWGIIQVAKSSITSSNSTPPFRWPLGCIWHHETNCDGEILSPPGFHTPHSNGVLSTSLVTSFSASCCFSGGMEGWYPQWLSGVQLFASSWTVPHQAPLSMEFCRQEYWRGSPFLLQGIFLTQGLNPCLLCLLLLLSLTPKRSALEWILETLPFSMCTLTCGNFNSCWL